MQFANKKRRKKGGGGAANDAGLALLTTQHENDEEVADLKNSIKGMLDKADKLEDVLERARRAKNPPRRNCVCG